MANETVAFTICDELSSALRQNTMKLAAAVGLMAAIIPLSSCHCGHDYKPSIAVGNVVCTDGSICRPDELTDGKLPVAVVFYVNNDEDVEGRGYAVWLRDSERLKFSDTLGVAQGTSTSINDFEGNANTYALYSCEDAFSDIAQWVFKMWSYQQSAYVPSVGQMRLLYRSREAVNAVINQVGGEEIPYNEYSCWYWTSTEVEGQADDKAWLYSLSSGAALETPKNQSYKIRPIITITD